MSNLTPPVHPTNMTITGDVDVLDSLVSSNGTGTIYVRNGGLYVEGLSDLDQTTINTNDGEFNVNGPNKVNINISGGATSNVEITAEDPSFFTTTAGLLTISSTATDTNGKVAITAAGTGTNSILVEATNSSSGQITIQSAGGSVSTDAVRVLATDTTNGNILIQGAGDDTSGNPAIKLQASNASSGQILITSAGGSVTSNSVEIKATDAINGNILIQSDGTGDAVELFTNNVGGKIYLHTTGTATDSINLTTNGGVLVDSDGRIVIDSADTVNGVKIATESAGVPITLGTSTSTTTIAGSLLVEGSFTTLNTESLSIQDNCILLNSGSGEAGIDSGVVMRRYQIPNDTGDGDVVSNPLPVQESGFFSSGSSTPATLVLAPYASDTTDFYKGWWIKINSGLGEDQVRRISSYDGTTKTATLYTTLDNTDDFLDGLDLTVAPAEDDGYFLYSRPFMASFYGESSDRMTLASIANQPDEVSAVGVSTAVVQQYQTLSSGSHFIHNQVYNNVHVSATGTTITVNLIGHGEVVGNRVKVTNSKSLTPSLTSGIYVITSVANTDVFTVEASASTVSGVDSSVTIISLSSSTLYVNNIQPFDNDFPLQIQGLSLTENIIIPKTSTSDFTINNSTLNGTYIIHVVDVAGNGSMAIFAVSSSGTGGSVTRIASSKGSNDQRIDAIWNSGQKIKIRHKPAGSGGGNYTYQVKLLSGI
jgi:hypothetical protein